MSSGPAGGPLHSPATGACHDLVSTMVSPASAGASPKRVSRSSFTAAVVSTVVVPASSATRRSRSRPRGRVGTCTGAAATPAYMQARRAETNSRPEGWSSTAVLPRSPAASSAAARDRAASSS